MIFTFINWFWPHIDISFQYSQFGVWNSDWNGIWNSVLNSVWISIWNSVWFRIWSCISIGIWITYILEGQIFHFWNLLFIISWKKSSNFDWYFDLILTFLNGLWAQMYNFYDILDGHIFQFLQLALSFLDENILHFILISYSLIWVF